MYYISYGSNMNLGQMKYRCPNTKVYGNGKLYGWRLVFNYHADIIYTGDESDVVDVVVWKLDDKKDKKSLDRYEGYPMYYVKEDIDVVMDKGECVTAMVYVMRKERKGIYPPEIGYFNCIEEGYEDNGIDKANLFNALCESFKLENHTKYNQYNAREVE